MPKDNAVLCNHLIEWLTRSQRGNCNPYLRYGIGNPEKMEAWQSYIRLLWNNAPGDLEGTLKIVSFSGAPSVPPEARAICSAGRKEGIMAK